MRSLLLSGPGLHTVVSFGEKPLEGDYRILIDAKQAVATSRVVVAYIPITDLFMKSLRAFPGVKITDTVQAPARSTGTELSLMLQAGTESAFIDVAVTDPRVKVNLRYPDGTIVNRENATAHRVTWDLSPWPPKSASGDLFGFGAAMQASMMLPVEGVHHLIYFARGVGATGSYAIQVNASGSDRASEVSAMFLPAESAARQVEKAFSEIGNPPLEPGETRVVSYAVESDQSYFALDKIDVKIGFRGAPLREPVQFSSRATVTAGSDQQTKPIDVPIAFARGADGLYHGVFIPPAGGVYQITTDIRGTQASGQPFSGESSPGVIPVLPLVAKMDRLAGRAVDTDGKGRPDRLEVTAHVDVEEAGEYRLAVNLSDDGGKILYGMAKAVLKRGQGQISVSFSGLQLYEGMQRDGPYHVAAGLALLTGRIASAADGRNGNKLTTGPYRRDSWDRGSFHGTAKISGQGVDLKGDGKFQIYRVRWDVVTPGGNCSWGGYLTPEARSGSDAFGTWKKRLAPGPTTLEFDFDGYFINKAGGQQAWKLSAPHVECDGKPIPTTRESSNLIDLDTGILRAEDFEPIPTGFRIQPAAVELKMRAGGTTQVFLMTIERIGRFTEPVTLRLSGVPTTVTARVYDAGNRDNASIYFYASALAKGGEYPIHVVAAGGGKEHEFDVRLVVDAPVTLVTSRLEPCPPVAPVTGPVTRKSVMLVLGANSTMRGLGCDAAKQFAQRFKEGLRPGLDALGIVEFNTSVHVALPLTSDFEAPAQKASEEFARVQCSGWSSTAYALEKAHAQLKRDNAKDSERVVVMVFSIQPTAIAAKWAVRTKADSRRQLYGAQVELPPSNCPDSLGRRYPQPGWATGDSMPDRIGALGGGGPFRVYGGPLAPAEGPLDESVLRFPVASRDRCGFSNGVPLIGDPNTEPLLLQDLAYLPETDLGGVPLDGPRRLARFENGPYSGKIRPDSQENRRAALNNLFEKALQRLVNDGVRVIAAHVSTYNDPKGLASIFNLAESPSFDARKQAGMLIAIHDGEQVLPMLERIWEALGITRRL